MFLRNIIVISSLLLFSCNFSAATFKATPRIMGGEMAAANQFPYMVSIRDAKVNKHFCGGALITRRNVLTAGHCLIGRRFEPDSVYVVLGIYKRLDDGIRENVERIEIHPEFNTTFMHNDIAIITTYTKVEYTDQIQPIALPLTDVPVERNLNAIGAGWGSITKTAEKVFPEKLLYHNTKTISWTECAIRLARVFFENPAAFEKVQKSLISNVICTKNPIGRGANNGDSGGPLVTKIDNVEIAIGISSWGVGSGDGYPDVYTKIFAYSDWIQQHIEKV